MTETCGIITANSADFFVDKPASARPRDAGASRPAASTTTATKCSSLPTRSASSASAAPGHQGVPQPCPTPPPRRSVDGWLHTGDIARIDEDGFIFIVDRAKDMVLRGGENVYCSEVETAIYEHPDVAEAAVFGIPDDRLGEDVAAAVVLRPGRSLTQEQLAEFLAARIAKFKIPATVWFRDEPLPQNANGKFLKRELRDELVGS